MLCLNFLVRGGPVLATTGVVSPPAFTLSFTAAFALILLLLLLVDIFIIDGLNVFFV